MNPEDLLPSLSVVLACRNEEVFIERCIRTVAASDYPKDRFEILVVDGISEDATLQILDGLTEEFPFLRVIPNPNRTTPQAFNRGLRASRGDVIAVFNSHSVYEPDYLKLCVTTLVECDADLVGGIMTPLPRTKGPLARAMVRTLSHPFGVGPAAYRRGAIDPIEVSVVGYGCYRREVFEKIGLYNEALKHSQDMDLNERLRASGGKILLEPRARCTYFARSSVKDFMWHNFRNGRWVALPARYTRARTPVRYLVPVAFVASLCILGVGSLFSEWARKLLMAEAAIYLTAATAASAHAALVDEDPTEVLLLPPAFAGLHLAYGVGTIVGLVEPVEDLPVMEIPTLDGERP